MTTSRGPWAGLAAIVVAVVIAASGALGSGSAWAQGDGSFEPSPDASPAPSIAPSPGASPEAVDLEGPAEPLDVVLRGGVTVPRAKRWKAARLTLLTNTGEAKVRADGSFEIPAVQGSDSTILLMAIGPQKELALLAMVHPGDDAGVVELSPATTARALVLFDPAFLQMPQPEQQRAEGLLAASPEFATFEQLVSRTLAGDPRNPLDPERHAALYAGAVKVAAGILTAMDLLDLAGAGAGPTASPASPSPSPSSSPAGLTPGLVALRGTGPWPMAARADAGAPNTYVWVEDDPGHDLPRVDITNGSFSMYRATITRAVDGSSPVALLDSRGAPFVIDRAKPYSLDRDPSGALRLASQREIDVGDGDLRFLFAKANDLTALELVSSAVQLALGVGTSSPEWMYVKGLIVGMTDLAQEVVSFAYTLKGKTLKEATTELATFLSKAMATHLKTVLQTQAEIYKREFGEQALGRLLKFVGHKAFFWAEAGYALSDAGAMAWSMANAPDQIVEEGRQAGGRYPSMDLLVRPDPVVLDEAPPDMAIKGAEVPLAIIIRHVPAEIREVTVSIESGGRPAELITGTAVGADGMAVLTVDHAIHAATDIIDVKVSGPDGPVLVSDRVPLVVGGGPVERMYTLQLSFGDGCDAASASSYRDWSSVDRLPVRIVKDEAIVDWSTPQGEGKHISASGHGTYDASTGAIMLTGIQATYWRDMATEWGEPVTGTETLAATAWGTVTDDPTIEYESFPFQATGSVEVDYPNLWRPSTAPSSAVMCSTVVTKARLQEGWVDAPYERSPVDRRHDGHQQRRGSLIQGAWERSSAAWHGADPGGNAHG